MSDHYTYSYDSPPFCYKCKTLHNNNLICDVLKEEYLKKSLEPERFIKVHEEKRWIDSTNFRIIEYFNLLPKKIYGNWAKPILLTKQ